MTVLLTQAPNDEHCPIALATYPSIPAVEREGEETHEQVTHTIKKSGNEIEREKNKYIVIETPSYDQ